MNSGFQGKKDARKGPAAAARTEGAEREQQTRFVSLDTLGLPPAVAGSHPFPSSVTGLDMCAHSHIHGHSTRKNVESPEIGPGTTGFI